MKIIGDPIFAKDESGKLKSRIGTIFFKTPGLVTQRGIHAMQRMTWIRTLNVERAAAGTPALTEAEEEAELADYRKLESDAELARLEAALRLESVTGGPLPR